jgi:GT2 family glycosyltransferase
LATERLSDIQHLRHAVGTADLSTVDIIVPVYKSVQLTTRCLNSLAEHMHEIASHDPRLIVINDSPDELDVRERLESFASRHSYVKLLENERNLGFVGTANRGLAISCKERRDVILVNADTETFPGTLENLLSVAYSDPQIGFVSPRSNNASFCSLPHFHGGILADQAKSHWCWSVLARTMPAFHFTPTAVGFYLFIKHAVIANFGFLDPEFGIGYEEENDLILRANKVGYQAALANHAFAYHAGSASFTLLDMNLPAHQGANLKKMAQRHPEYLPLIRRYEDSAHFRAERLLSHALPSPTGRLKIVFDLSSVGPNFNGTNEMGMAIIEGLCERHASRFEINVICTPEAFKFHKLDRHEGIRRHNVDLETPEKFAIGVQIGQPFTVHAISVLEDLAVVNIFGMLDTIANDCGHLAITHQLDALWSHVARYANGLFYNSKFSEQVFDARFPDAKRLSKYARLLPTKLSGYKKAADATATEHVLIMGNHFAHKASDTTAEILRAAFPTIQFVVLGKQSRVSGNVRTYRAGTLSDKQMGSLYTRASIVVLPSHVEGFGLGLVHALAAGKVVVARDIPATREILATYKRFSGVFLYAHDSDLMRAVRLAMNETASHVEDDGAESWHEWVDGFADFSARLLEQNDLFSRLVGRIQSGDSLRRSELLDRLQQSAPPRAIETTGNAAGAHLNSNKKLIEDEHGRKWLPVRQIKRLLSLEGEEFVYSTYVTILNRLPDSDGLVNYLTELQSGISKLEIIARLRNSSEGRKTRMPLTGYRREVLQSHVIKLFGTAKGIDKCPK